MKQIEFFIPCCSVWWRNLVFDIKEEHTLRVFDNRVLRRIFGPKRDDVAGDWRKLHNEELHNSYSSSGIIRIIKEDEMGRACSTNGGEEECI
jgi:hypothetical protein